MPFIEKLRDKTAEIAIAFLVGYIG